MMITFITIETPSLKKGAPVRIYNLIKQAVKQGATVDVIAIAERGENIGYLTRELGVNRIITVPKMKAPFFSRIGGALFGRVPPYFIDYRFSGLSDSVLSYLKETKPDIILLEELFAYDAIARIMPFLKSKAKIILDAHNVEYKTFMESISTFSPVKYLAGRYIASRLLSIEIKAARNVHHIFTCSKIDKSFFSDATHPDKITVIPNGVDCSKFTPEPLVAEHTLIFLGGTYYPPNNDALRFYFRDIHPLVKKEISDMKITLLGGEPPVWLKNMAKTDNSIITPGLVPDVRTYIQNARICISPMRKGSGTSLKILEYMGSGKPIVSTTVGIRGISCINEEDALLADNAVDFSRAITRLLGDDALAVYLGNNARKKAETAYDWNIVGQTMRHAFETL